jgi:hypothetical protein
VEQGVCHQCDDDASSDDCPATTLCQGRSQLCVQCLVSTQCSGKTPLCDLPAGRCVACLDSRDCFGATPFCDPLARRCVVGEH